MWEKALSNIPVGPRRREASQAELAPVVEGVVGGDVLARVRAVGVAVALGHHAGPLHVRGLVLGESGLAPIRWNILFFEL